MIRNFSDHAANERTYLAWVRTSLAVVGFGLAIIKFEFFPRGLNAWVGLGLGATGCIMLALATFRFIRTSHEIEREETHRTGGVRGEIALTVLLVLFVATFGVLLWSTVGR